MKPTIIKDIWNSSVIERLFDSSGMGFVVVGIDQRIADANLTFCNMLGYSLDELCGMHVYDYTHPDDMGMTHKMFAHARESNLTQAFEKRYVTKSGGMIWCKLRSEPVMDESGNTIYRFVMVEDITQAKRDEISLEQMAAITESSDDAIFRSNPQGIIEFWGKGAERMYGYSAAEAVGQHASFIADNSMAKSLARAKRLLYRGEVVIDPDAVGKRKDGSLIDISVLIFPIKNRDGFTMAHAAVHRDMSAYKLLEQQLRHAQRLETAGLLAGGIAHDFNNIITVIQSASNLLAEEFKPGSHPHQHLDLIERSAERATRLTRQLLAFSRKQKLVPTIINPNNLIRSSLALLQRSLGDDVRLETTLASSWCIREDATQLEQVLLNLAVNARHAMAGGGRLYISTSDVELKEPLSNADTGRFRYTPTRLMPGTYVRLQFSDNGCGMDQGTLEKIFDPFFTTRSQGEGTGLGLSVVYGMVTQAGGGISVISAPGHGTEFDIYLPRTDGVAREIAPEPMRPRAQQKGRILVVEDDEGVRMLTAALLENAGYTVYQAANPREVLDGRVCSEVDLILSDVVMPDLSGPEFAEIWLQQHPDARFMFMSGYFDEETFSTSLRDKVLIQKPFKPKVLIETVAGELARRQG
jgi:two-component system cell cycle sensor histidine kinase/response regulator CckA